MSLIAFQALDGEIKAVTKPEWDAAGGEAICDWIEVETSRKGKKGALLLTRASTGTDRLLFDWLEGFCQREVFPDSAVVQQMYDRAARAEEQGRKMLQKEFL